MKKVKVDQDTCVGCGVCVSVAPKSFKMAPSGKSEPTDPVGDDEATVKKAIDSCPVGAISFKE